MRGVSAGWDGSIEIELGDLEIVSKETRAEEKEREDRGAGVSVNCFAKSLPCLIDSPSSGKRRVALPLPFSTLLNPFSFSSP